MKERGHKQLGRRKALWQLMQLNLLFILGPRPGPLVWQKEHLKGLVGCGISVYTAFFAFGSVRILPELALHPVMWAIPLTTGVLMILYHWRQIGLLRRLWAEPLLSYEGRFDTMDRGCIIPRPDRSIHLIVECAEFSEHLGEIGHLELGRRFGITEGV